MLNTVPCDTPLSRSCELERWLSIWTMRCWSVKILCESSGGGVTKTDFMEFAANMMPQNSVGGLFAVKKFGHRLEMLL